jgi:3-isopropylmalate/(R)-2-methylmalate dehydratase small subunit
MTPFTNFESRMVALPLNNVDTDQIIPARFLRKSRKDGYGQYLFCDLRFDSDGKEKPGFVLNEAPYRGACILVADKNFGCGSSREHAVYALWDYGFRAVIAPSFGDIFFGNSFKNGFLPIVLPAEATAELRGAVQAKPGARITVDLASQLVTGPDGTTHRFEIDSYRKECLLKGIDELDFTLARRAEIAEFERRLADAMPWL